MEYEQLKNIRIVPQSSDPSFDQRESGISHTTYLEETAFYSMIQSGSVEMVQKSLNEFFKRGIIVGRLSDDELRQTRYWAVCCITLGIRYAIQGGLDEMEAYNFSDSCIRAIDKMTVSEDIVVFLEKKVLELASMVRDCAYVGCPVEVRKCLVYIDKHLHETIRVDELADLAGFSNGYISKLFKKHVGQSITEYILSKKLDAAKALLRGGCKSGMAAYYLGFCSEAYFIDRFKKRFGMTPKKFLKQPF